MKILQKQLIFLIQEDISILDMESIFIEFDGSPLEL